MGLLKVTQCVLDLHAVLLQAACRSAIDSQTVCLHAACRLVCMLS